MQTIASTVGQAAQVILLSSDLSSNSPSPAEHTTQGEIWWPERAGSSDAPTTYTTPDLLASVAINQALNAVNAGANTNVARFSSKQAPSANAKSVEDLSPPLQGPVRRIAELMCLFCMCHVCIGFSMGAISPAMETISRDFSLSDAWRGLLGAAALAGNIFGSPLGGILADLLGRRACMLCAWVVFVLSALSQSFAPNILALCIARVCLGWSVGAHYAGTTAYLSEILVARGDSSAKGSSCGFWLSIVEAHFFIGNFLSLGVGWLLEILIANSSLRWRVTLGCCALPVIIGIPWFFIRAPETEAWLQGKNTGKSESLEADSTHHPDQMLHLDEANISSQRENVSIETDGDHDDGVLARVTRSVSQASTPSSLGLAASIFFVSTFWGTLIVPTYAVSAFAVFIIHSLAVSIDPSQLNACLGAAAAIGVFLGVVCIDKLGRKRLLLLSQWGVAVAFMVLAILKPSDQNSQQETAEKHGQITSRVTSYILIFAFLAFEVLNGAGSPLALVYPAEIFPSRVRGMASGIS